MKRYDWKARLNYKMDIAMSRGTSSLIRILVFITLFTVIIAAIAILLIEESWAGGSFPLAMGRSLMLTLDAGNLAGIEGSRAIIIVAAVSTLCGIFITSALISILNTGFSNRLERLQRGNSRIIESGHTVILGFNEAVFSLISELQIANENKKDSCIVVLGEEDKLLMEEQIQRRVSTFKSRRVICRSGDPASAMDLERASLETCKSVIINQNDDAQVITNGKICISLPSPDKAMPKCSTTIP